MSDNKIVRVISKFFGPIWKWTAKDFRKVGVDTRYASEIVKPGKLVKYPLQDIVRHNKESIEQTSKIIALEKKLEAAAGNLKDIADVFRRINRAVENETLTYWQRFERVQELTQEGLESTEVTE